MFIKKPCGKNKRYAIIEIPIADDEFRRFGKSIDLYTVAAIGLANR